MRSRNIKPGIFTNPDLARMGDSVFRLFIGLWCLADRKGRLKDDPDKIEAQIFPFRFQESNTKAYLELLAAGEDPFIIRYEAEGVKFIQIKNFLKHQNPHPREAASEIPPSTTKVSPRHDPGNTKDMTSRADVLIPSSLRPSDVLIPDSYIAPGGEKPYRIPEPTENPTAALAMYFKAVKLEQDHKDRTWDKIHMRRTMTACSQLLSVCKTYENARACMDQKIEDFKTAGHPWTLETVVKYAHEWKAKQGGRDYGPTNRTRFFDALAKQRSEKRIAELRKVSEPGEVVTGVRDLPVGETQTESHNAGTGNGNGLSVGSIRDETVEAEAD